MSVLTTKMTNSISPKVNFFIREEKCTPVEFFKKFNYTAKSKGVSDWCSSLSASLALSNDEKLVELEQKYNNGHYTRAIDDYFLSKQSSCVLNKEKASIDKTLTKRTSKAIRSRIEDLLPEETGSKKPRLMESQQNDDSSILMSADPKIKQEFPGSCSSTSGPSPKPHLEEDIESKYYDAGKRHKIHILTKMITRFFSGFSKITISPTIFEIFNKKQLNKSRKIRIYVIKKIFIKF
ncbi:hypothetical protein GLOIN_2v1734908, partial [Rhizophagus irregularis DAOM 181602=DAOM 197198]